MKCNLLSDKVWRSIKHRTPRQDIFACRKCWVDARFQSNMKSIDDLTRSIRNGQCTARAAITSALDAAEKLNGELNAFLEIDRKGALQRADQIDALDQADKNLLPLAGV